MHPSIALATGIRVLQQLRRDPRTVALLLVVPCVLVALVKYVFDGQPETFDRIGVPMLGIFPFISMFLVTSIAMLRERTTGTLERLMTMPLAKLDILVGYGLAFALLALAQGTIVSLVAFRVLDLHCAGKTWHVLLLAVANALLGMALGLFVSAFAETEFQAVQFMPVFVLPQFLLCGLLAPRNSMAPLLGWISWALPLTYAYDALARVAGGAGLGGRVGLDLLITIGATIVALALGAATLRRRTA